MSQLFGPRQKQSLVVFLLLLTGIAYYASRTKAPDEEQIRKAVKAMVEGAEDRDLGPFKRYIAETYSDARGNDKKQLLNYIRGIFFRHKSISVTITSLELDDGSDPTNRLVTLSVFVGESLLPEDKATFFLTFEKKDGWQMTKAEWEGGYEQGW